MSFQRTMKCLFKKLSWKLPLPLPPKHSCCPTGTWTGVFYTFSIATRSFIWAKTLEPRCVCVCMCAKEPCGKSINLYKYCSVAATMCWNSNFPHRKQRLRSSRRWFPSNTNSLDRLSSWHGWFHDMAFSLGRVRRRDWIEGLNQNTYGKAPSFPVPTEAQNSVMTKDFR